MEDQSSIRLQKLDKLRELGVEVYPYAYDKTHHCADILRDYGEKDKETLENEAVQVSVAGRLTAIRSMGKSAFAHLLDGSGKIQIYFRKDRLEEKEFEILKLLDIGDIVGVSGKLFRTQSNELTIQADSLTFLTKSLHPLPEKWHGLQDKELRHRQRFLDLIVNEDTRRVFSLRSELIQEVRLFFYQRGYREVETPMMQPLAGGASAKPFVTHHNALDIDLYLRIAPELYLKRLLVGGMEKVFEINRNFRNEGTSQRHNPEFTMIEFYELYKDLWYYLELTEDLICRLNNAFTQGGIVSYNDQTVNLNPPFARIGFMEGILRHSKLSQDEVWDEEAVKKHIAREFPEEEMPPTFGKQLDLLFSKYVEPTLKEPTFVTDFPVAISPLTKRSRKDPRLTERFELYIAGMEMGNAYSELNDPVDQRGRLEAQLRDKEMGDDEAQALDEDFLRALEQGMAPAAGEGIGIDRLVMLYAGVSSIREVILFPLLRPKS